MGKRGNVVTNHTHESQYLKKKKKEEKEKKKKKKKKIGRAINQKEPPADP